MPTLAFTGLKAWESEITLHDVDYIEDHKFVDQDIPIVPGAVFVEMIFAMSIHLLPGLAPHVESLSFDNLLTLSNNDSLLLRTRLLPYEGGSHQFQITNVYEKDSEVVLSTGSLTMNANCNFKEEGNIFFHLM